MGNMRSVAKALELAGARVALLDDGAFPSSLDAVCVPGQGIFGRCMTSLRRVGFDDAIARWIGAGRAYLGICLGLQVLLDRSEEPDDPAQLPDGSARPGLGVLGGDVVRLEATDVTIPHIGWNMVHSATRRDDYFYFDHSYVAVPDDPQNVAGTTQHGTDFPALIETGSILAVQFHPEKSGRAGISLLQEWVNGL